MVQQVTFIGNAAGSPELKFGPTGSARATLTVMCQDRYRDTSGAWVDGDIYAVRGVAFGEFAERIAASVGKGDRVLCTGSFRTSKYDKDGETRYSTDFRLEDLGVSCRWAEVRSQRVRGSRGPGIAEAPNADPWASAPEPVAAGAAASK